MRLLVLVLIASQVVFGAFSKRRAITIDNANVPSTQTDFPVLIAGTIADLATTGNGGDVTDAQGDDIGFYSNSDCSTGKLDWEVESYTAATGAHVYWVKVPSLSSSADTVIYLCYADAGITTDQSNKTGVWDSNYKLVLHGGSSGSLTLTDSTSNANNATNATGVSAGAGKIHGGFLHGCVSEAARDNDYLTVSYASSLNVDNTLTIQAWVKPQFTSASFDRFTIWSHSNESSPPQFEIGSFGTGSAGTVIPGVFVAWTAAAQFPQDNSTWSQLVYTRNGTGTTHAIYVNGASSTLTNANDGTSYTNPTQTLLIGARADTLQPWCGMLDEVRLSSVARSADWLATEYSNINNPGSFYTAGSEEDVGGGAAPVRRRILQ